MKNNITMPYEEYKELENRIKFLERLSLELEQSSRKNVITFRMLEREGYIMGWQAIGNDIGYTANIHTEKEAVNELVKYNIALSDEIEKCKSMSVKEFKKYKRVRK